MREETNQATETAPIKKPRKKRTKRSVVYAHVHVLASMNNTIISVTDPQGALLASASAGSSGFRGSKKGTAYAAQVAAEKAVSAARQLYGMEKADVFIRGVGMGRDAATRTLINQKVKVENLNDITGVPHGGVRPRKARRT